MPGGGEVLKKMTGTNHKDIETQFEKLLLATSGTAGNKTVKYSNELQTHWKKSEFMNSHIIE